MWDIRIILAIFFFVLAVVMLILALTVNSWFAIGSLIGLLLGIALFWMYTDYLKKHRYSGGSESSLDYY